VLAAGAEAAASQPNQADAKTATADGSDDAATDAAADPAADPAKTADAVAGTASADPAAEQKDQDNKPILAVHVDELGIYDLLKQKKAA
jgi:hypothetical protein